MPKLEQLHESHAEAVLAFEVANRAWFARSVPDRGDDYFAGFAARHAALLAEQAAGTCRFHVLVDDAGAVLGRFNLLDFSNGAAELGFRMAERAAGRGLAKLAVRQIFSLARDDYGLRTLIAFAAEENAASRAVLRGTGFVPAGVAVIGGVLSIRHIRDLADPLQR
ncbi:GNAT family N-acetyltransferase [Actinoplanes sp. NEAU-A12]|uniref:GNAT family N-acetyltransferase n=1 Tax=Actinoplanes sandaracinus TaxID=3045177 RepID=A0ABT6WRM4_9ACTN|nr:GNAT family N-acetyltransferase [Actinoplanes sandaracinus]MDI6102290.1 GNAT family N-acetyltransferase [Actinoplanes sandaracinus]